MEDDKRAHGDLKVTGTGAANGGQYHRVRILGEYTVDGDLRCSFMKLTGTSIVHGNLQAEKVGVTGVVEAEGDFSAESVHVVGELRVRGDCNAEHLRVRGALSVDGLLNAEELNLRLHGPSHVKEIGGGLIRVRPNLRLIAKGHKHLLVHSIEGDDIHLENTKASVVRGNRVHIGPGCEIGLVEYQTTFRSARDAKIREHRQV